MKLFMMLAFTLILSKTVQSQEFLVKSAFDYSLSPVKEQETLLQIIDINADVEVSLGKLHVIPGLGLRNYDFSYAEYGGLEQEPEISNFHTSLGLRYDVSSLWTFSAFGESSWASLIGFNETVLKGGASFIISNPFFNKPNSIELGLAYETYLGQPQLLPIANLQFEVKKLQFQIGFPSNSIRYSLNSHNSLTAGYIWEGDYFYLPGQVLTTKQTATASINGQKASLTFKHDLDENWSFHIGAGYQIENTFEQYDNNMTQTSTIDLGESPVFSTGIKFNISNNKN